MSHDEFTRLFNYMERRFDEIEYKLDRKAESDKVEYALDLILKKLGDHDAELAAINAQLNRHEGWFRQLATNTGTILVPEP